MVSIAYWSAANKIGSRKRFSVLHNPFGAVACSAARRPADSGRFRFAGPVGCPGRWLQATSGHHALRPPSFRIGRCRAVAFSIDSTAGQLDDPSRPTLATVSGTRVRRRHSPNEGGPIRQFVNRIGMHSRASFRQRPRSCPAIFRETDRTLCAPSTRFNPRGRAGISFRSPPFSGLAFVRDPHFAGPLLPRPVWN